MTEKKKGFSFNLCSFTTLKLDFEAGNTQGGFKFCFQPGKQHRRSKLFRIEMASNDILWLPRSLVRVLHK